MSITNNSPLKQISILILIILALSNCKHKPSPAESMADFCNKLPRPEYQSLNKIDFDSDWFELYNVAPGVTAIYEPFQWQEVISYLIEGNDSALLFDTGNGIGDISKVIKFLTEKPVAILNSHSHYDHVGGNYSFNEIYGMNTEFTINRQKGHPNSEISIEASKQALCKELPKGITKENHIGRPYKISRFIENNHLINLGNRTLEVIHTPGHTPDAIILIDRKNKLMWTGDSYYSGPIWLFAQETNLHHYQQSLEIMISESKEIDWLLPAHNTPLAIPTLLPKVLQGIKDIIAGNSNSIPQGEGMIEYKLEGDLPFSFIMRDEILPYKSMD